MAVPLPRPVRRAGSRVAGAERRLTASFRELPDYLIIGAQKGGSSSLYRYLIGHPSVLPARKKEVHFFDVRFDRGVQWYRSNFPTRLQRRLVERRTGARSLTGEASPYYLVHPRVPERVAAVLPDARLVAVLRDPVERAISNYHHQVRLGHEARPLEVALAPDQEPEPADADWDERYGRRRRTSYLARGRYAEQLERWWRHFSPEQLLVIDSESLTRRGGDGFDRVVAFLGLAPWRPAVFVEHMVGEYPAADPKVRDQLAAYYQPHNRRLFELVGVEWDWTTP